MGVFNDVVGQKDIVRYIKNAVKTGNVCHAYILSGEALSGKKLFANLFAMSLACDNPKEGEACGNCRSCRLCLSGNHRGIIHVSHEKPSCVGIDDIRSSVISDVGLSPCYGRYKIYVVKDADKMTEAAQNALLKTLEEPPLYVVLFLLAENAQALLPTVRSRCVSLSLRPIPDQLVKKYLLEHTKISDHEADICTAFAKGNIGRALTLANSEYFNEIKEEVLRLMRKIDDIALSELMEAVKRSADYKIEISDYFDVMEIWFRDVLVYKATKNVDRIVFSDQLRFLRQRASKSSYEGIEVILEALQKAKDRLKANVNFELTMELLLLSIKEN